MRVFLSYPSEHREIAGRIRLALMAEGHRVFFDRSELPPGEAFDAAIRRNIQQADLFVFLISPESISKGAYTIFELKLAQAKWAHPSGHILPTMVVPTDIDMLPAYLRAVTILEPEGDLVAEVAAAVAKLKVRRRRTWRLPIAVLMLLSVIAAAMGIWYYLGREHLEIQIDAITPHSRGYIDEPDKFLIKGLAINEGKENELLTGIRGEVDIQGVRLELSLAFDDASTELELVAGGRAHWAALASFASTEAERSLRADNIPSTNWRACLEFVVHEVCSDWQSWQVKGKFDQPPPIAISKEIGSKIRNVAPFGTRFLAGAVKPNRLLLLSPAGQIEKTIALEGEPVAIASDGARIAVATQIPDTVAVIDALTFQQRHLSAIPGLAIMVGDRHERLSTRPAAVTLTDSAIWITTAGGSGGAGLLYSKDWGLTWQVPNYYDGFDIDARDLRLRATGQRVWGITTHTSPSSIYSINVQSFIEFGGHDYEDVSCAADAVILTDRRLIIRDCDFQLIEIKQQAKRLLKTASFGRIVVEDEANIGANAWTQQILAHDGDVTLIAVTQYPIGSEFPIRSGIAMHGKDGRVRSLLEAEKVEVLDMATAEGKVLVVIRKADGSYLSNILPY